MFIIRFGPPASNTDLGVNDFDEPQLVDSRSDGIVSIGSEPEEGLVRSFQTNVPMSLIIVGGINFYTRPKYH